MCMDVCSSFRKSSGEYQLGIVRRMFQQGQEDGEHFFFFFRNVNRALAHAAGLQS